MDLPLILLFKDKACSSNGFGIGMHVLFLAFPSCFLAVIIIVIAVTAVNMGQDLSRLSQGGSLNINFSLS